MANRSFREDGLKMPSRRLSGLIAGKITLGWVTGFGVLEPDGHLRFHPGPSQDLIKEFVQKLDDLLAASLRLTREEHRAIFRDRDQLVRCLRGLLEDHAWVAARREQARIREQLEQVQRDEEAEKKLLGRLDGRHHH